MKIFDKMMLAIDHMIEAKIQQVTFFCDDYQALD